MSPTLTLAVFAKSPVPGRVKTRLCPPLEPITAARLYAACVRDTIGKAVQIISRPTLYYADGDAELRELLTDNASQLSWTPQSDGDLGARMARVPAPCLILGTDSPHLPVAVLHQALNALNAYDVVLGPAEDGGYYLIGLTKPCPALFEGIAWSTGQVFVQTQTRARTLGLTTYLLPPWYDIDTAHDLRRLTADMTADCPATRAVLDELQRTVQLF